MQKNDYFVSINGTPDAIAKIKGDESYSTIQGTVWFYQTDEGVLVVSEINGLPMLQSNNSPIFAFHIHEGKSCSGTHDDLFSNVGTHYNPKNLPHPYHAGDLPPLFSANGKAFSAILTNRFSVNEIIGKTIIIHANVDDFVTQPSGNSGKKIACGEIVAI
ncbi:MAG: superoxide dismutase family protein [Candidatus Caccovivens sp.]